MELVKIEKINGVLVTTSNRVAEELGVRHKDLLEKIDGYISKFGSAENSAQFYMLSKYKASNGRDVKNFLITEKGVAQLIGGYSGAVEKAFDLNIIYINKFEEMKKALEFKINDIDKLKLDLFSSDPVTVATAHKKLIEHETAQLVKEIEHKENVIIGLTDEIDLMDMRQILNRVVRHKCANFHERWGTLYFEFEKKYHINLKVRMDNYNRENKKRKITSKLDYIDKVLNKLPQLYALACKLFEGDINEIIETYKGLR